jgi:hypothetical protein
MLCFGDKTKLIGSNFMGLFFLVGVLKLKTLAPSNLFIARVSIICSFEILKRSFLPRLLTSFSYEIERSILDPRLFSISGSLSELSVSVVVKKMLYFLYLAILFGKGLIFG